MSRWEQASQRLDLLSVQIVGLPALIVRECAVSIVHIHREEIWTA
jgi:hypothetical protein